MNRDYIKLMHEFAASRINTGFLREEMLQYLVNKGLVLNDDDFKQHIDIVFGEIVGHGPATVRELGAASTRFFMLSEAYYRHLGYLEMKSAQDSSKGASRLSLIAIGISSILALIQILIALQG